MTSTTGEPNVTAVVSIYNPATTVVAHCQALIKQVGHVVVVDDGSPAEIGEILVQLQSLGCQVIRLKRNSGIATALNSGIRAALQRDGEVAFILTMDQDSLLEHEYTGRLVAAHDAAVSAGVAVGMVAPGTVSGLPTRRLGMVKNVILGGEPIQSGLLIPRRVIDSLGPLMDELFIDGVDTEFFLRARDAGLESVVAPDARIEHALGSMVEASFLGVKLSPFGTAIKVRTAANYRYYYIFRNRLILVRQYWRSQPAWAIKGLMADYRHLAIVTFFAPGRRGRLSAFRSGVLDGIRGRTGPRS